MTDDKKHPEKDTPAEAPSDATSSIPEVEAEIVGEDEAPRPGAGFDDGEESVADEAIAGETAPPPPPKSWLTPGVILLTAFALVAVVVVFWRLQSGGEGEVQTLPPVAAQDGAAVDGDKVEQAPDRTRTESEPTPPQSDGADAEKITNDGGDIIKEAVAEAVLDENAQQTDDVSSLPLADSEKINAQPLGEGLKDALQAPGDAPERDVEPPQDAPMKFEFEDGAEVDVADPADAEPVGEPAAPLIEEAAVFPDAASAGTDTAKIENDMGALKQAMRSQMADIAAALDAERARSAALEDEIAALRQDFAAALDERDARAAAQWSSLRADLDKIQNVDGVAPAQLAAGIVALSALERAVNAGAPFARELELLAGITPDAPAIRTLRRHADSGVPTLSALQESFGAAARASLAAAGVEKHGAIVARLMGLISVRPAKPEAGDSPAAIISRAEDAVSQNDIARALDELSALPEPARAAMHGWLEQAQARAEAETAVAALGERFTIENGK
ncbi:MAG: hypothetical protein GXP06_05665 [Alphaproteobacteria bacterium]|nr:hypothetical protein [Alphaproteobacteria bacterium]